MNKIIKILIWVILLIGSISIINAEKAKKSPQLYFNDKSVIPAMMDKDAILSELEKRLWANDSVGKMYMVSDYSLGFVERGLFFDQEGKPMVMADYFEVVTEKGVITKDWKVILEERLKSGDTIKITNPKVYTNLKTDQYFYGPSISIPIK